MKEQPPCDTMCSFIEAPLTTSLYGTVSQGLRAQNGAHVVVLASEIRLRVRRRLEFRPPTAVLAIEILPWVAHFATQVSR